MATLTQVTDTSVSINPSTAVHAPSTRGAFCAQLKSLLSNYAFVVGIPYVIFYFAGSYESAAYLSPYGASWFGGCNTWKKQSKNSECLKNDDNYDYDTYNFYISIFTTLMGLMSFLFSGFIGRLSDSYGRKLFFVFYGITKMIPWIPLIFVDNIWYYFALMPVSGLNGGMNSATPIMIAYMADVVPEDERTIALGLMYFLGGIGLMIGAITGAVVTIFFGFYTNILVVSGIWVLVIIGTLFLQHESLPPELRKPWDSSKCYNPFRPLTKLRMHPIVFWIGILQLFISLPETGIVDMATVIVDDLLNITNVNNATELNSGFSAISAMGNIFGNLIILPFLTKFYDDLQILVIGSLVLGLCFASFAVVPFVVNYGIAGYVLTFVGGFLLGCSFISFPAANSIVTRYLHESEQGEGMGIVYAMRSVTFIVAPLGFASLYKLGDYLHFKSLTFIVGGLFALCALITTLFPLKNAINQIKYKDKRLYFSTFNLNQNGLLDH